jgi:DMSO reductase anchor subunit
MHPALSVIFFTTLSGAGYGLWFLLAGSLLMQGQTEKAAAPVVPLILAFVLVSIGLLASTAHLGKPLRAWRAFSQWRTSWLSREGVASLATYVPAVAIIALVFVPRLSGNADAGGSAKSLDLYIQIAAALLMLGCAITVYCTARIYSSLPTIAAWQHPLVAPGYLLLSLYSGALWCWAFSDTRWFSTSAQTEQVLRVLIVVAGLVCVALKLVYWKHIDETPAASTPESATGLGMHGKVRAFERPHTEENYLTKEMGFVLARKHAAPLRVIALLGGVGIPLALLLLTGLLPALKPVFAWLSPACGSLGIFVERWLFFAQARHTVMLYYGAQRA